MTYNDALGKSDQQIFIECAIYDALELFNCDCPHCVEIHNKAKSRYYEDEIKKLKAEKK